MRAETACPDASKFETFIPLVQIFFELKLFKPTLGISVFGLETRITRPIDPKSCTKNDLYVPHVSFKIQVSTFSRFKVIAFFIFDAEFVNFTGKNIATSNAKRCESPNLVSLDDSSPLNAVAVRNTDLHTALRLNLVYTNSWV